MWANSVWGFLGLGVTFLIARLSMLWTTGHEEWGPILVWLSVASFACLGLVLILPLVRRLVGKAPRALAISFDRENPHQHFWSMESPKDERGVKQPGVFWEYRVLVTNVSRKTVRNVRVVVEGQGALPLRPQQVTFDIDGSQTMPRLNPQESRLAAVLRWPIPVVQAGMVVGEDAYGPLRIVVSGDDVQTSTKTLRFDYQRTPMLFE